MNSASLVVSTAVLKQAIDNELLYQAGIKEGLDKDPTYLKQLEMQKRMAVHREVESLATA